MVVLRSLEVFGYLCCLMVIPASWCGFGVVGVVCPDIHLVFWCPGCGGVYNLWFWCSVSRYTFGVLVLWMRWGLQPLVLVLKALRLVACLFVGRRNFIMGCKVYCCVCVVCPDIHLVFCCPGCVGISDLWFWL